MLLQVVVGAAFIASTRVVIDGRACFTLFDDAMVSMTYARHFAEGAGLVWNPGGPYVEGYTNFLWTLWMAMIHLTGVPERLVALVVMVSGLSLLTANLVVVWRLARAIAAPPAAARIAVIVTSLCYPLMFWTLRGMEVGLMALVVDLAVLQAVAGRTDDRPSGWIFVWMGLAPLIRPDGIVPALIVAACAAWRCVRAGRFRAAAVLVACPLAVLVAHTLFRWAYYGDLLPNTYYLKVAGIPLADRLARGAATLWETLESNLWVVAALALLVRRDARLAAILGVVIAQVLYSVWVGGDAWEQSHYANRYISVVLPLAVIAAASGAWHLFAPARRPIVRALVAGAIGEVLLSTAASAVFVASPTLSGSAVVAIAVIQGLTGAWFLVAAVTVAIERPFWTRWPTRGVVVPVTAALLLTLSVPFAREWLAGQALHVNDDARMMRLGLGLRAVTSPDASIAVVWAGAIPYFSHRRAIDLLGKSDAHVARLAPRQPFVPGHDKWDYAYSVGHERPDVIAQTWRATAADRDLIRSFGYEPVGEDAFVRIGTLAVDRRGLAGVFDAFDRNRPAPGSERPQR